MKVCAVILKYNHDLTNIIEALKRNKVDKVIAIDNSKKKKGVAQAFSEGIQAAIGNTDCELIWLLDDDNIPRDDALGRLVYHYQETLNPKIAFTCLRRDTKLGSMTYNYINNENAVLGFHLFKYFQTKQEASRDWGKLTDYYVGLTKINEAANCWRVACAMYGGLLFHRDIIKMIGLPDERFTLYAGDYEWTNRIEQHEKEGAGIYVVTNAVIDEPASGQMTEGRIYEATKGHVMFQKKLATNKFMFWINFRIYYLYLLLKKNKIKSKALVGGYYA